MSICVDNDTTFECLNGGQCSATNSCICSSACFVGRLCEFDYNAVHLTLTGAVIEDSPSARDVYILIFVLFASFGLINNLLSLMTCMREPIRITICGVYLILYSVFSLVLTITLFTYIITIVRYRNEKYQLMACHFIPYVSVVMSDGSMLVTVAIAVEQVLMEQWNFSSEGPRKRAFFIVGIIILFVCGSNLDEIFIRRISRNIMGHEVCIYNFNEHPNWRQVDVVFSYSHVIIPCVAHIVCSICILTTIARRKLFIHSTSQKFYRVWLKQLYLRRQLFIPPICIIICLLPHGILGHLLRLCIPYSNVPILRLHISFVLLLFVPQMASFILYVYPNKIYWKEFQKTVVYRRLCYFCYRRERAFRRQQQLEVEWKRGRDRIYTSSLEMFIPEEMTTKL